MTQLQQAAYDIGAKGSEPTEAERLAFESWMRGHCWAVIGEWDGKHYKHAHESTGFVHGGAMETRRLWAAWRDRGAVARVLAEQAKAVEPVAWTLTETLDKRVTTTGGYLWFSDPVNCCWTPLYTHPAPPPAGEVPAGLKELLSAKPITGPCGQCKSSADPCYCGNVNTGERAELIDCLREHALFKCIEGNEKRMVIKAAYMLEADAQDAFTVGLACQPKQQVAPAATGERAKVGNSNFESWYGETKIQQMGTKQRYREAYEAGLNEAQQVAVHPGYALAMAVLQSSLYQFLDDVERAECDALIAAAQGAKPETEIPASATKTDWSAA